MNRENLSLLKRGDLVRHKHDHRAYVVTGNYGNHVTAVSSVDMTNPSEWDRVNADGTVKAEDEA